MIDDPQIHREDALPHSTFTESLDALRLLYEAATDAGFWRHCIEAFARLLGSHCGQVIFFKADEQRVVDAQTWARDPRTAELIGEGYPSYLEDDPRLPMNLAKPWHPGPVRAWHPQARPESWEYFYRRGVINCRMYCPEPVLHRSRIYQELLYPADAEYLCGLYLSDGNLSFMLMMMRGREGAGFVPGELEFLDYLIPHFRRAIRLRRLHARLHSELDTALHVLDVVSLPTVMVRSGGELGHINPAARELLVARDGLDMVNGALTCSDPASQRLLDEAIAAAHTGNSEENAVIAITRNSGRRPYTAVVSALDASTVSMRAKGFAEAAAAVFLTDPEHKDQATAAVVQRLYGLTSTEARVLEGLLLGKSAAEIAVELGSRLTTVRTHVRNLLVKTGTKRQGELIRLGMLTPAWLIARLFR